MLVYSSGPPQGWRTLKGSALNLPGEVYMSETMVRKELGSALTRNLSTLRLVRLLSSEQAVPGPDGGLKLESFAAMRMLALGQH